MYLKKLEIQGFKSFAQKTGMDFEKGVSVVVGPNGSGKSNVADALRFVLGEQGMKNIRAKKSEDLIFSGSGSKGRLNIAQVTLYFDNKDKTFPVDFSEVSISRKIFRDGENQYFVNNSQVRLKDLAELIAKAKLGLKGYTIISQGMGDYILNTSPKERKEIIDDALGLREYQIKKNESILKLNQTKNNLEKTESIIRELSPNLRFLKKQVEKLKEKEELEKKLSEFEQRYLFGKFNLLKKDLKNNIEKKEKLKKTKDSLESELKNISGSLEVEEKKVSGFFDELKVLEKKLFDFESKKSHLERELGKIEGAIDFQKKSVKPNVKIIPVDISYIKSKIEDVKKSLSQISGLSSVNEIKTKISDVISFLNSFSSDINLGHVSKKIKNNKDDSSINKEIIALNDQRNKIEKELNEVGDLFFKIKEDIRKINSDHHKEKETIFNLRAKKKDRESALSGCVFDLNSIIGEINRIENELSLLEKEEAFIKSGKSNFSVSDLELSSFAELSDISREVDRVKIRLETVELIDESVLKEYEEVRDRIDFLNKEVEDLNSAIESLNSAISKLDFHIESKFKNSFSEISKNFGKYFNILFGGGSAKLELVKEKVNKDNGERVEVDSILGVDVFVSLPRKKVSSLSVLSGGERTLTSLALLFALISISPPPFLVLDEVDAPLDEANSNRFLKIIDTLKHSTQFIIITHNRETMRKADVLYGVTMQDDGISKLLSLRFDQAEKIVE